MARTKSTPGGKSSRATIHKEQNGNGNSSTLPDVKSVAETAPVEVTPEASVAPQATAKPEAKYSSQAKAESQTESRTKTDSEPKVAVESRKMELMKSDGRKNLLPINLDDEIRRRAYELYQQRGHGSGNESEDWLNAEREIRQRYRQQSA